ncbi:ABC transporter substrate-binding protein [Streptomyces sp. NPDC057293]|uniref:ABC transporter substrate-binding protein n=1 Tax=unclassified Streptomyces TaxID=2593676 RepID=UPI00363EBF39
MTRTSHLLGLALSLALAATTTTGCGPFGAEQDGPVELSVRASATDRSAVDAVVAEFHRLNHDTHITVDYSDTGDLQQGLPGELRAGDGPDVFTVWPGNGNPASVTALEHDDRLENLSLRRFNLTMPIGVKPVTDVNGSTFAVPVTFSGIGTVFSTEALDAIGGAPPRTWTELLTLCDKARDHDKVLLALGNATPWVTQLITYALVATTVYADEPDFDRDMELGKESFADSGWRTALRKYMEMDGRDCFNADPLDTTYEETLDQVATGRAVGVVQVASVLSELRAAAPGLSLRMTALPATDDPDDTRMPGAVSAAYGLNPDTPHRKEALAFIDFLGSARGQNLYNRSGATLPAIPNASFTVDPAIREVAERQKAGTTVPFMDQRWPNSAVQQTHFAQVEALFSRTTDIEAALAALDKAYRERT